MATPALFKRDNVFYRVRKSSIGARSAILIGNCHLPSPISVTVWGPGPASSSVDEILQRLKWQVLVILKWLDDLPCFQVLLSR